MSLIDRKVQYLHVLDNLHYRHPHQQNRLCVVH